MTNRNLRVTFVVILHACVLLAAIPDVDRALVGCGSERSALEEEMPALSAHISGCPFHPRGPMAKPLCVKEVPEMKSVAGGRFSRCHFARE